MNAVRFRLANVNCYWKYYFSQGKRHIYSSTSLGLDSFTQNQRRALQSVHNLTAAKERFKLISDTNSVSLVLMNDLHKMASLTETDEDLEIVLDLLKKYNMQNALMMFQNCTFGPQIMRLLHVMNKPKEALMLVEDENLIQYFQHYTSMILILNLLFTNNMYEEVIRCFKHFDDKFKSDLVSCHNNLGLIFLAACCKLNTPESFQEALQGYMLCLKKNFKVPLKHSIFIAVLAINHNQPHLAIKVLMKARLSSWMHNVKLMAYAKAKRFDQVFELGNNLLVWNRKSPLFILNETLSFMEKEVNDENVFEFNELSEKFAKENMIINETIDDYLYKVTDLPHRNLPEKIRAVSQ